MALTAAWDVQGGQMEKMLHQEGAAALEQPVPASILGVFHSSAR